MSTKLKTIRTIAPEDLRPGMYITVMHVTVEFGPSFCEDRSLMPKESEPSRMRFMPWPGGTPLRIVEECLPFVLVEMPNRQFQTMDLRRFSVSRLSKRYGKLAFENMRKKPSTEDVDLC